MAQTKNRKLEISLLVISCIALIVLTPLASALTISGVSSTASDTWAVIEWKTDEAADSTVDFGTTIPTLTDEEYNSEKVTEHSVIISGLSPAHRYYFDVKSQNSEAKTDNNGGAYYNFQTLEKDTAPPQITATVPEYTASGRITITGSTEPVTAVRLYVNGVAQRKYDTEEKGTFEFDYVELSTIVSPNIIMLEATDSAGNKNTASYNIYVDLETPEISATVPELTKVETITVSGTVSEQALVEIFLNNNTVFANRTMAISVPVTLKEGANALKIKATDNAGHSAEIEKTILLDTKPPEIKNIAPKSGTFFYEGNTIVDIEGDTDAGAAVEIYLNREPNNKPDYSDTADSNGHFKIRNVNIEGGYSLAGGFISVTGTGSPDYTATTPEAVQHEAQITTEQQAQRTVVVNILAKDLVGFSKKESVRYTIGTCYSGTMDWNVISMIEYQAPTMLSPERLSQGTEMISFVLNFSYQGQGEKPTIKDVTFERMCKGEMLTNPKYNYSCQALPSAQPIKVSNDARNMWYIRYNLNQLKGLDAFPEDLLKSLANSFVFPLKIKVRYSHEINGNRTTETQMLCMDFAFTMDTSRIDPRKILPDWLLDDGLQWLNESSQKLNKIVEQADTVVKYAAAGCAVTFGMKIVMTMYRTYSCWSDYISDKASTKKNEDKCPAPGGKIGGSGQTSLTNTELDNKCPSCKSAWDTEAKLNKLYRFACDRFLCKGTPAKWTETATAVEVRTKVEESILCSQKTGTEGTVLREDKECTKTTGKVCWDYEGKLYSYSGDTETDTSGQEFFVLKPINPKGELIATGAPIKVIKEKGAVMLQQEQDCAKVCKGKKWNSGECMTTLSESYMLSPHRLERSVACANPQQQCFCYGTIIPLGEKQDPPQDAANAWDYRYDKLGYYYNKLKYYDGRDYTACFGLNNFLYPYDPYLNPADTTTAIQCLCTSQIRNRLVLLRNIMQGVYNCLQQVKTTGKANTGVCKEIFTQYVCKWLYQVVTYFMNGCVPWTGIDKDPTISDYFRAGSQSIFGAVEEATGDLMSDYDNAALRDYLGVGEGAVVEKVCLGAFTGDWGIDLRGIMDAAYAQPYHTSVSAPLASREYLTWNPSNFVSTYEYRVPWMISSGCKIDSYTVSLACISQNEYGKYDGIACGKALSEKAGTAYNSADGCDCNREGGTEKTRVIYTGRNLAQGTFEDRSVHVTAEEMQRYDHVKVKLFINDAQLREKCLPEGHKDGVFYFPITDMTAREVAACRYDVQSGTFICDRGQMLWNLRGTANFGKVQCNNEPCETKMYYLGDDITINPLEVFAQGKPQCLVAQLTTRNGKNLLGSGKTWLIQVNETQVTYASIAAQLLESIDISQLRSTSATIQHTAPAQYSSNIKPDYGENLPDANIAEGTYSVYFWRSGATYKYIINPVNLSTTDNFKSFNNTDLIFIGGIAVRFNPYPTVPEGDTCTGFNLKPCVKYEFQVTKAAEASTEEIQTWKISLELRYAPGENNEGNCAESSADDIISYRGELQKKDISIRVNPKTRKDAMACKYTDGFVSNSQCDCNGNLALNDAAYDCDGTTKKYCYNSVCYPYARCKEAISDKIACDCDWSGTLANSTGTYCEGMGMKYKYCWENSCHSEAKPITQAAGATTPAQPTTAQQPVTPQCPQKITQECLCGGAKHSTGYCCNNKWQVQECPKE